MKASEQKSYILEVQEIEICLAEELVEVCRDYYQEVWIEALNLAGVLVASEWRKAKNVYYPPNIRKALAAFLGLGVDAAPAPIVFVEPSTT